MEELVKKQFYEIFSPEDIETLIKFDELEKRVKAMKDAKNQELKDFLLKNELKEFENEDIKITYVAPSVRKVVDTNKLKEQGLYEDFLKESHTSDSVRITIKYDD